jgi:hypothetical protein
MRNARILLQANDHSAKQRLTPKIMVDSVSLSLGHGSVPCIEKTSNTSKQ